MKLGPVTKIDETKTTTSRILYDDVILANYDIVVDFAISGQFGAIQKLYPKRLVCNVYIFINNNFLPLKTELKNL